jgi:polyisoprenoid-binding protein YceI
MRMSRTPHAYAWLSLRGVAMAILATLTLSTAFAASATAQNEAASPSASECNVEQAVADAPVVYAINGEESTASYVAMEELASVGANEFVGTTNAIIGSILFDGEGNPLPCSNFAVDMRTLVTDENRRDNYLRENTLESDAYPFAIFIVSAVEGLDGPIADGETVTATLVGDLTLHGVTKTVSWDAEITRDGDTLSGTASHTFMIEDYEMEKPIVGPVVSIEDEVTLTIEVTASIEG